MTREHESEASVLNKTMVAVSARPRTLIFRNNTGQAWVGLKLRTSIGQMIKVTPGMVVLANARPIKFGLPGSGDITGSWDGRPLMIETKTLVGPQRETQKTFEIAWKAANGIYILGRSAEDIMSQLDLYDLS